jgi:hypothetical protein
VGLQDRERLDKVVIHPDGTRWGQFEVSDLDLLSIPPYHVKVEVMKCADRLGMDAFKLEVFRPADRCVQIVCGPMKPEAPPRADYISNRRHIDLSILE